MAEPQATPEEREEARQRIVDLTWDEMLRVVKAIRAGEPQGFAAVDLTIKLDRFGGGPALVIAEATVDSRTIAQLQELAGQNLDLRLDEGRIELYCPSWPPDRIPF